MINIFYQYIRGSCKRAVEYFEIASTLGYYQSGSLSELGGSKEAHAMLEAKLGYKFRDNDLLTVVFTRTAAVEEGLASPVRHASTFSRLKFLGARVLSLLVSDLLFATDLFNSEGGLTVAHSRILSHNGLIIKAAKHIDLDGALIVGKGERLSSIQTNDKVLFAHMQALFGAIWIDSHTNYSIVLNILLNIFKFSTLIRTSKKLIDIPNGLIPLSKFDSLQVKFGHIFTNTNFLLNALIRQSALEEKIIDAESSFQTLEFLGDKVFGCIVAEWLISELVDVDSDVLTPLFNELVCNSQILPKIAKIIMLGDALIIGVGEEYVGIRSNQRKLADHVEALIAALWLDVSQDYKKTQKCVIRLFRVELEKLLNKKFSVEKLVLSGSEFPLLPENPNKSVSNKTLTSSLPEDTKSYKEILTAKPKKEKEEDPKIIRQKFISIPLPFWGAKDKREMPPVTNKTRTLPPKKTNTSLPRHNEPLDLTDNIQFPTLKPDVSKM